MREAPVFRTTWRRATSASSRSPTPSRFASTSKGLCRRRGCAVEAHRRDHLRLPQGPGRNNPRTVEFARELRSKQPSDAAYVDAVLDWFHHEACYYTLSPPLLGTNPLDEFLFGTRRGFWE